jgi:hypothetical protein
MKLYERRVNLNTISEYRPLEKYVGTDKTYYSVKIKYIDSKEEEIPFFDDKGKRDEFLENLDKNLVTLKLL